MQLNPQHLTVANLLSGRLFRIPNYQRAYSWRSRQRKDLFRDILEVDRSKHEHFMATIVTLARDTRNIGADEFHAVDLVDGQQRLTTLIMLFKAVEKALRSAGGESIRRADEVQSLLVKDDEHSLILLQTNHDSSRVFPTYVSTGAIDEASAITASDMNLIDAANECEKFVNTWDCDRELVDLLYILKNRLSMIYHEVQEEAVVYRVFEVLNSRGLDVKWIDKLKSQLMALIFEHIEDGTRTEAVDEMQNIWQGIYRKLGLEEELGNEALRFAGTWALESRPNKIVSESEAAAELTRAAGTKLSTIATVGEKLRATVDAVHWIDSNARLKGVTRIRHARFVATAILLRKFESTVEQGVFEAWERVTFRIFGLNDADSRSKVGDYVQLGYEILSEQMSPDVIIERLKLLGKDHSIDNALNDFNNVWNDCYSGWTEELRYLLFRYDEYLASVSGQVLNKSQWNKVWLDEPGKSIEHIQPQSSDVGYVHHLGNLTMLPPKVNSSLKDKKPKYKAQAYQDSGLKATIAVGQAIQAIDDNGGTWSKKDVYKRAKLIEEFIRSEWAD